MRTIDTTVKMNVLRRDCQNTGSSKALRKLRNPAQSYDGLPAVTSLKANAIARKNGSATSATM